MKRIILMAVLCLNISNCAAATPWGTSEQNKKGGKWTDMAVGYKEKPMWAVTSLCAYRPHPLVPHKHAIKLTNLKTGEEHIFLCAEVNKKQ